MTTDILILNNNSNNAYKYILNVMKLTLDLDFMISKRLDESRYIFTFIDINAAIEIKLKYG